MAEKDGNSPGVKKNSDPPAKKEKQPSEMLEVSTLDFRRRMLLSFPPTALALLSKSRCLVGGGGGSAKTGVPNRVCCQKLVS
jgi:hypothetical protein